MTVTGVHHGEQHTMVARSEPEAGLTTTTHQLCINGAGGGVGVGEPQQSAMRPWLLM